MLERIKHKMIFTGDPPASKTRQLWPWMVAAGILAIIISLPFLLKRPETTKQHPAIAKQTDIDPGGKHAYLTRSDGSTILLDTVKNGKISETIEKENGLLEYQRRSFAGSGEEHPSVNRIITPAGGEYQVILGDGTKVWLNAGSSLQYDVPFGKTRQVELIGEAYFEVVKDPAHPFVVVSGITNVEVLGTRFNLNAYPDQKLTVVTLAEGSVKINQQTVLKPGEQAKVNTATTEIQASKADLEPVLAWTKGAFLFRQTALSEVMEQIAHWYDARIVYQDNITEHFNASIPRNVPVSKVLHLLESTGSVHFRIENRTITVIK